MKIMINENTPIIFHGSNKRLFFSMNKSKLTKIFQKNEKREFIFSKFSKLFSQNLPQFDQKTWLVASNHVSLMFQLLSEISIHQHSILHTSMASNHLQANLH